MPKKIYNTPLCKYRKKKKRRQQFNMYYMYICEYVSGKPTDSSPRNRFKTSPSSFSSAPLSTYLTYPVYLKVYIPTCYLHGSSFFLHVLKKAKRLKRAFRNLLRPYVRKTYLILRTYTHHTYIYRSIYDLVYNTLHLIPYPYTVVLAKHQVGKSR